MFGLGHAANLPGRIRHPRGATKDRVHWACFTLMCGWIVRRPEIWNRIRRSFPLSISNIASLHWTVYRRLQSPWRSCSVMEEERIAARYSDCSTPSATSSGEIRLLQTVAWIHFDAMLTLRLHSRILGGVLMNVINFAVTFLVAKLSYDLFEVRFLRWKKNFEYDSELRTHKHAFTTK